MAATAGSEAPRIEEAIAARGRNYAFLQALWLLCRARPEAAPLGGQGPAHTEPVRLQPTASLAFPPGEIESYQPPEDGNAEPGRLTTTFLGLYGAHSPLPSYYSEDILHRAEDEKDHPVRAFLDIFNHRLLSLLYRGLIKYRGYLLFEENGSDEFSWRLYALAGLICGDELLADGLSGPRLIRFAGLLSQKPRSAAAVESIISVYLNEPSLKIEPCVVRWVYLSEENRSVLGQQACKLGDDATIGERVRDSAGKFRIHIGPVDLATYRRYLPGGDQREALGRLVPIAAGDWLAHDVRVVLRGEDTQKLGLTLGSDSQLGRTTGFFSEATGDISVIFD